MAGQSGGQAWRERRSKIRRPSQPPPIRLGDHGRGNFPCHDLGTAECTKQPLARGPAVKILNRRGWRLAAASQAAEFSSAAEDKLADASLQNKVFHANNGSAPLPLSGHFLSFPAVPGGLLVGAGSP